MLHDDVVASLPAPAAAATASGGTTDGIAVTPPTSGTDSDDEAPMPEADMLFGVRMVTMRVLG